MDDLKNQYCVIMAGGIGSRFWPMSKTSHPKQFIDILGTGKTLLQQTYERFQKVCPPENIYIVTHRSYTQMVVDQLGEQVKNNILVEPFRKNTAPCIAYACYKIRHKNPDALITVSPSDHLVLKEDDFAEAIKTCYEKAASGDYLLTLGIEPTRPDTGYGYIQFVDSEVQEKDPLVKRVKTFTEKPNLEMAKFFLKSGDFLWNAGIFIFSAKSIVSAFEKHLKEMSLQFNDAVEKFDTDDEEPFIEKIYGNFKSISIDYGIMEKASNVYVRSSSFGWSDLGTWGSLYTHIPQNDDGNAVVGKKVMMYDSKNCLVHVPANKLVVIQGLKDYIVVESDNVLLICKKSEEQQIRTFVNDVKVQKGEKFA